MEFFQKKDLITVLEIFLIIIITHTIVFMAFSYFASGDAFLALRNFYGINYHLGV